MWSSHLLATFSLLHSKYRPIHMFLSHLVKKLPFVFHCLGGTSQWWQTRPDRANRWGFERGTVLHTEFDIKFLFPVNLVGTAFKVYKRIRCSKAISTWTAPLVFSWIGTNTPHTCIQLVLSKINEMLCFDDAMKNVGDVESIHKCTVPQTFVHSCTLKHSPWNLILLTVHIYRFWTVQTVVTVTMSAQRWTFRLCAEVRMFMLTFCIWAFIFLFFLPKASQTAIPWYRGPYNSVANSKGFFGFRWRLHWNIFYLQIMKCF